MHLYQVIAIIFGFTIVGLLLREASILTPARANNLNSLALSITLPAGIFRSLHAFPIERSALLAPLVAAVLTVIVCGVSWMIARALRMPRTVATVFLLSVAFSNTAFVGYPVVLAIHSEAGLRQAVLIDQLAMEPLAFTLGAAIAVSSVEGARVSWSAEMKKLGRFPPLMALTAAILWRLLGLPALPPILNNALGLIALTTVPLVMVALGLVLRLHVLRRSWRPALGVSALRLVAIPAVGWVIMRALGAPNLQLSVTTLELGMPGMMFTFMLALKYGLDAELSAGFITATLIGSMATLPAWAAITR